MALISTHTPCTGIGRLRALARPSVVAAMIVSMLCILVQWQAESLYAVLRYERDAVLAGQWWRLWTNGLCHLGWSHLWLNLATLGIIIALFFESMSRASQLTLYGVTFGAVGVGVLAFNPEITGYVGISGALQGLLLVGATLAWRDGERVRPIAVWLYLAVKLGFEQSHGALPTSSWLTHGMVAVDAHFYGFLGGLFWLGMAALALGVRRRAGSQR